MKKLTLTPTDRFGRNVAALLTENNANLSHVVCERLRASREQSVALRKRGMVMPAVGIGAHGVSVLGTTTGSAALGRWFDASGSDDSWWSRWGSLVPLVALVAGIWIASGRSDDLRIAELAQVDAAILIDDLPPAAYADPGFAQYLRDSRPPDYR